MFDGKVHRSKSFRPTSRSTSNSANAPHNLSHAQLLEESRKRRENRAAEKLQSNAATVIQAIIRSYLSRQKTFMECRKIFTDKSTKVLQMKALFKSKGSVFIVPKPIVLELLRSFFVFYNANGGGGGGNSTHDNERLKIVLQLYQDSTNTISTNGGHHYVDLCLK